MEFQTSSVAAKLSTGHSIYDGVFSSAPTNFTVSSSFSSTLDDYREIFGAAATSSSIPVLEVPELKERKAAARNSQLDYSNVFGGFADSDSALPFEQLFNQPRKITKTQKETRREGERVSPAKEANRSGSEEGVELANGAAAAYESIDGVKKFSMSYNQSNNRSKSFSGVHSVPAYTCLVDHTSPLHATDEDKPVSISLKESKMESYLSVKATSDQPAGDAGKQASREGGVKAEDDSNWKSSIDELFKSNKSGSGALPSSMPPVSSQVSRVDKPVSLVTNDAIVNDLERKMGDNHDMKATVDKQTTDASKQMFGGVAKVQDTYKWRSSGSVDKFFYSGELTQETRPSNMPSFPSMHYDGKGEHEKLMDSVFRNLNRDIEGADNVSSPPYFEEEADTNSVAAASVAALTKAIEEAQASIQMAKGMMDWKKGGPQSRVKLSFDNSMKPKLRRGSKVADKACISVETKPRELNNKVDVLVHDPAGPERASLVLVNASTISDVIVTGEEARGNNSVDNASRSTKNIHEIKEEFHVSAQPEQVTAVLEDTNKRSGLMEARGKVQGKEFQGYLNIFSCFTKKTNALQEDVHISAQPQQAPVIHTVTDTHSDVMKARDKVLGQELEPTPTDHMHEEPDDAETADQFYEFGDTSEQDISEAADQFYEFADSSEPDVSETSQTTEEFYEFADSNEQQDVVENKTAESPRQTFLSVDYDEQEKKTDMEAFENSEQVGKKSKSATVEQNGGENISNVVREVSEFEDNFELASSQEYAKEDDESILNVVGVVSDSGENDELTSSHECPKQEDDVNPQGEPIKHEETVELETTHIKETYEEKQYGDEKRFETQEVPETEHEDVNLLAQECDENEKIDKEGCMLKENEREPPYWASEEGTDGISNEDKKEEIIESVSFYDKEDFEKRLEDDRNSEQIGKLEDTTLNEEKIEEATCQECENTQQEIFEFLKAERIQLEMDESTRNEKEQKTQDGQENLDCNIEAADNLNEQDVCEDLPRKQESGIDVKCDQDVKETVQLPINNENREVKVVAEIPIHLVRNEHQIELVEEKNDMVEKETCETDGLTPDAELSERLKQKGDATNTHSLEKDGTSASESDMSFVQKQDDQLAGEPSADYNVGEQVGESEKSGDINSDMLRAEVALNQERNKNSSKSRKRWFGADEVSEPFIKLEGDGNQSESVEEEDVMEEKVISEIEGSASGVKFTEILKQLEDVIDIHPSDTTEASVSGQKHDVQLARELEEVSCNLLKHGQRFGDINKDMMEPEVAFLNQESINITKSSHRKRWFDDGKVTEVAQTSPISGKAGSVQLDNDMNTELSTKRDKENHHKVMTGQSTEVNEDSQQSTLRHEEGETIHSSSNEFDLDNFANPKTTFSEEGREAETNFTSQKDVERETENQRESKIANDFEDSASSQKAVELENQRLIQKEEKRRERERQKEKRKVAHVIREARERSFADVKERVAESRQKVIAEAQGKSGKTYVHTDDASLEKASKEAKAKRERSFVERANVEARDRALEKALSEKAAAEASKQTKWSPASTEKQAKRSVSEIFAGSSGENRQSRSLDLESKGPFSSSISRSPNSTNQSDPSPAGQSTNGESAQRCKAILERNQRTAERAAKALAEKNNRDLLVQQEQAERNRLAEVIGAEVKRWSSGKERNLRALLSTLQYILGPDSGWQPVHLTDIVTAVAVKKAYRKAALYVHPDKLQQRGASIQQKYTCEKVFDLLKDAWNRFSMEER